MFYDLNVPYSPNADRTAIDKLKLVLARFTQNNECTIAFNHLMAGYNDKKIYQIPAFDMTGIEAEHPIHFLTRVTIVTNEPLSIEALASLRKNYDLVALRTNDIEVFKQACQSYDIDIISLYPNERLEFELDRYDIELAMSRNVYFEVCYAPSIRDNQARVMTLQLAKQLIEYTKGAKLIISSEAEIVSELRSPGDIFYFAKALGLANDKAVFSTKNNGDGLLYFVNKKKLDRQ